MDLSVAFCSHSWQVETGGELHHKAPGPDAAAERKQPRPCCSEGFIHSPNAGVPLSVSRACASAGGAASPHSPCKSDCRSCVYFTAGKSCARSKARRHVTHKPCVVPAAESGSEPVASLPGWKEAVMMQTLGRGTQPAALPQSLPAASPLPADGRLAGRRHCPPRGLLALLLRSVEALIGECKACTAFSVVLPLP